MQEQIDLDVIVVGAGASGLMAAWELAQAGKKVAVLEANDRIGGRIYPIDDTNFSITPELGAEFVHGKLKFTDMLIKRVGSELYEADGFIRASTFGRGVWQSDTYETCATSMNLSVNFYGHHYYLLIALVQHN